VENGGHADALWEEVQAGLWWNGKSRENAGEAHHAGFATKRDLLFALNCLLMQRYNCGRARNFKQRPRCIQCVSRADSVWSCPRVLAVPRSWRSQV